MKCLNHVSLFSGIGGFDLAAEAAGFKNCASVEINPFCRTILSLRFPDAKIYEDVTTVNGADLLNDADGHIDVLSGGFPCQPISGAGKRLGQNDDRWMWNDYARIIRETKPSWVIIENSSRLFIIPEWGGVQSDLEKAGYEIQCFRIPAAGVGAPHIRERAVIVAHTCNISTVQTSKTINPIRESREAWNNVECGIKPDYITDTQSVRLEKSCSSTIRTEKTFTGNPSICGNSFRELANADMRGNNNQETESERASGWVQTWKGIGGRNRRSCKLPDWKKNPSCICRMDDGFSVSMDKSRLQALGNAVVPRVFFPIFDGIRMIEEGKIK